MIYIYKIYIYIRYIYIRYIYIYIYNQKDRNNIGIPKKQRTKLSREIS